MGEGSALFAAIARHAAERPKALAVSHPPPCADYDQWRWELLRQDAEYIAAILHSENRWPAPPRIGWLQHNHPRWNGRTGPAGMH